jgi:ADP-heptose:LPS heptosyltransferase
MNTYFKLWLKRYGRPAWHSFLRMILPAAASGPPPQPKRILLMNGGHIGDIVIATSLLPVLRSAYPNAEIGFLTATWSHGVVRNHPEVAHTHCVDHWRMNRQESSFVRKRLRYWRTRRQALKEVRALSYNISFSLHPWRADFLPLAWQAGIPERVAFSSSLWAPLATALAEYPDDDLPIHQGECQARLLRQIGIESGHLQHRRSSLGATSDRALSEVRDLIGLSGHDQVRYSVIHMGAGVQAKELPLAFWRDVASRLSVGQAVIFTGRGARESSNVDRAIGDLPRCYNACDRLSWDGFVAAIRYADTLYSVDSMASHVAAAVGTKCVAMFGGMNTIARWRPEAENCVVWSNPVPCSPCHRQHGCAVMTCMQGFAPLEILHTISDDLPSSPVTDSLQYATD